MDAPGWREVAPPDAPTPFFGGVITTAADLTRLRRRLQQDLVRRGLPPGACEDDVERLLLAFEELTSNGLRHGRPAVHVQVATREDCWLIDVSDAAPAQAPKPAVDRDPAHGGLGLCLVGRLSTAYGWWADGGRKHVWACVRTASPRR